jgi:hypothetical protein
VKRFLLFFCLLFFFAHLGFTLDFGLILDQSFEAEKFVEGKTSRASYSSGFNPWFSWDGGREWSFYVSGILSFKHTWNNGGFTGAGGWKTPVPLLEFSRSFLRYRSGQRFLIEAGRIPYTDSTGIVASGLFDGLRFNKSFLPGDLTLGAYYTGFLYKESAKILMTPGDVKNYAEPCDWDTFGAFFAPRRALITGRWDLPLGEIYTFSFETLFQFDLTGDTDSLHSQYWEVLFEWLPLSKLGLSFGAVLETMEEAGDFDAALGCLARLQAEVPGSLNDSLRLSVKFSTGPRNDGRNGFIPVSALAQGSVFDGTISGLVPVSAGYTVRLHHTLLLDTTVGYFFRTFDQGDGGRCYGGEGQVSLSWLPLDDVKAALETGLFFPGMGNIYPKGTGVKWKITAGLSLSL